MDAVLVEIAPPEASREHQDALLRACGVAARPLTCVARESSDEKPALLAIVVWEPNGDARIEVGVRREARVEWAERRLSFSPADPEKQRWEAAGLAAGTVAASLARPPREAPSESTRAERPKQDQRPAADAEPAPAEAEQPALASSSWGVDLALLVSSGFEGSARAGGALGLRYAGVSPLRLDFRGSLSGDRSTVELGGSQADVATLSTKLGAYAGAGFQLGFGEIGVLAGPFVERVGVQVESAAQEPTRLLGGAELTLELRERVAEHFLVFLAGDAGTRFGSTFVAVDGETVGRLPAFFVGARVGLGASF